MTVAHATPEDLAPIEGPVPSGALTDVLRPVVLVAVRAGGLPDAAVHALGWRQCRPADVWATSLLQAVDREAGVVVTSSRRVHAIHDHAEDQPPPALHRHPACAFRAWVFDDVRAA